TAGRREEARELIASALAVLDGEPGLDPGGLRDQLAAEAGRLEREAREEKAGRDRARRRELFARDRNAALFHETLAAGLEADDGFRRAAEAASAALARFGLTESSADPDALAGEPDAVKAACFELYLIWAEALASPPRQAGDRRKALGLI